MKFASSNGISSWASWIVREKSTKIKKDLVTFETEKLQLIALQVVQNRTSQGLQILRNAETESFRHSLKT